MKKIILTLLMVVSLVLVGCSSKTEAEKIAESYGLESADHVFDLIDLDEIDSVVEEEQHAIIYFGAPKWPGCVWVVPRLDALAKEHGVETIYYVYLDYQGSTAAQFAEENRYDYAYGGTPLVVLFQDGEYSFSNFTHKNPDSELYDGLDSYYPEVIKMFETF